MKPEVNTAEHPLDLAANGIWQRLPAETPQAYAAFAAYLELGDPTLNEVAEHTGRSHRSIRHLSWRHNWADRAAAYRQYVSQGYLATMQQERVRQTELAQMRDQLFRQELWEQRQSIREVLRKGFRALLDDSKSHIAAYELARLMEIDFKSGVRATAPTGFTFDGPVPANPQFEAEMEKVYGKPMPLDQLLDLMLLAHPDKEEMIRAKINAAAAAGYPFSNPDLMKYLDPSEKIAIASPSSAAPPPSSSNSPSTPETTREPAVKPCLTQHATCNPTLPSRPPAPVTPHSRQHSELETRNFYHVSRGELGTNVPLPPRILNRHLDPATLHSRAAAMERYIDSTLQQREPASTKPSAVPVPPDPTPPNDA